MVILMTFILSDIDETSEYRWSKHRWSRSSSDINGCCFLDGESLTALHRSASYVFKAFH